MPPLTEGLKVRLSSNTCELTRVVELVLSREINTADEKPGRDGRHGRLSSCRGGSCLLR